MRQSNLFEKRESGHKATDAERVILYALGDFQARGKLLAERDLPLDRLRGAFKRAAEIFGVDELDDEQAVSALKSLGASVRQVPSFFAKHPFRVVVPIQIAARAREFYDESTAHEATSPDASASS